MTKWEVLIFKSRLEDSEALPADFQIYFCAGSFVAMVSYRTSVDPAEIALIHSCVPSVAFVC